MILDSSRKFIALEYSNPIEKSVIDNISYRIFTTKHKSVKKCGSYTNIAFASNIPYLFFLLTVTDEFGKVIDDRLENIYDYMKGDRFLELITSYCLLKDEPSFVEIWDVCIFLERRSTGIGNLLIQNALTLSDKNFWLVVLPDNTAAATLYIKNGFVISNITQTNSSGSISWDSTPSISMIFDKQSPSGDVDTNNKLFKIMSDRILGFVKIETLNIKIEREVINFIDSIVKNQSIFYEVGGCLLTKHTNKFNATIEDKDGKSFIVLGIHKNLIKGTQSTIFDVSTDYNFMFITHPATLINYNGILVNMPSEHDMTICVHNMVGNIGKLIKTQKLFIFSFDVLITINVSSELTEFILEVLNASILPLEYLQLCFRYLTAVKMLPVYQKSFIDNQHLSSLLSSEVPPAFIKQSSCNLTCSFINTISVKDLAESDHHISSVLLEFFKVKKGIQDPSSISVFHAEYHEIPVSARSEGFYITCGNTVVPRNLAELKYSDKDMVDLTLLSREDVLSGLTTSLEGTEFVLQ